MVAPVALARQESLLTRPVVRFLLVLGLVAAIHGVSVTGGLWLDDHVHWQQCAPRRGGWQGMVQASRLDLLGQDRVLFWGGHEWSLRFFRPLAFTLMKLEYTLVGWQAGPMHVFSLLWNVAAAMLVGAFVGRVVKSAAAGTLAALLFAVFPNNAATIYWIACQTELMVTVFCLTSVLAYGRWSGWFSTADKETWRHGERGNGRRGDTEKRRHGEEETRRLGDTERGRTAEEETWRRGDTERRRTAEEETRRRGDTERRGTAEEETGRRGDTERGGAWFLVLALIAYAAAMGCRENAVALPGVLVVGDLLSRRPWRRRIGAWAVLACVAAVYMLIRQHTLGGMSWPQRPYVMYPGDPGFLQFVWRKLLYYLSGLFLCLPVVPGGTAEYAEKGFAFEIGAAVTLTVTFLAVWLTRRRLVLIGLVWPVIMLLPLLPLFPSPHHLYLSGVGSMLLWTAALVGAWRWLAKRVPALAKGQPYTAVVAALVLLLPVAGFAWISGWVYLNSTAAEDEVVREVLRDKSVHSGDQLLFINLPLAAPWITWAVENGSQGRLQDLTAAVLTVADMPAVMTEPSEVIPIDRHTLELQIDPPGWLYGGVGELFAQTSGVKWPVHEGQQVAGPVFNVTVEKVDPQTQGVTRLRFEFHEPIDRPGRHVYFGSRYQMAYPLHFRWGEKPAVIGPPGK